MRRMFVLAGLALALVAPSAHAGFIGDTMTAAYYYPDASTVYGQSSFIPSPFTIVGGEATVGNVEGVTFLHVDFTDTRLTITLDTSLDTPAWSATAFNGPIFTIAPPGALGITGAAVSDATTMTGFDAGRVTFSDTTIGINWQGLSYENGTQVVVDFTFVPEPSSVIALGVGCALPVLAGLRRRRRRAAG